MIIENNRNRLAIYFFYDKDGIVDNYVYTFLDDLKQNVSNLLIVSNGTLEAHSKSILERYGHVIERENKGFDVWAYKTGLDYYGWEKLETFDEIIMINSTIMGPLYPFKETFDSMDSQDVDFWGLTEFFSFPGDPSGACPYGYLPDHIQSHWIACRRSLVKSRDFHDYWDHLGEISTYWEAVGRHEMYFTKHFCDLGYSWKTSVPMSDLRNTNGYPLMMCPHYLIKERRCPIFKRRSFFNSPDDYLTDTLGETARALYDYIEKESDYDTNLIWDTILRNYNQADIVKDLNLSYILPKDFTNPTTPKETPKVALILHLYFDELVEDVLLYAKSMPEYTDVYITTDSAKKKERILQAFSVLRCHKLEVRVIENKGRDVGSLLVGVKDIIMNYDIACFAHDKKTAQVRPYTMGIGFRYKCFENILGSKEYVENILSTFNANPRLGMLSPPEPNHGDFFPMIGNEWTANYKNTKALAKQLDIRVPIEEHKAPISAYGTMFWFRPKAFQKLYAKDWQYDDFPPEPNPIDGTLLHAIERVYSFAVQDAGFFPGIVMTSPMASLEYGNLKYYLREYNQILINHEIIGRFVAMRYGLSVNLDHASYGFSLWLHIKKALKDWVKNILPPRLYENMKTIYLYKIRRINDENPQT